MRETTVTLYRPEGTQVVGGLRVQIDQVSIREQIDLRGAIDYQAGDYFKVYTTGWYYNSLLQRDDVLTDDLGTDPETGTAYKYRVVGRVKNFEYDHQECYVRVVVGG
jgi:hypothetical protein